MDFIELFWIFFPGYYQTQDFNTTRNNNVKHRLWCGKHNKIVQSDNRTFQGKL